MSFSLNFPFQKNSRLIKEFEREARNDSMPADELLRRKEALVHELNTFISIKKTQTQILNTRMELLAGSSTPSGEGCKTDRSKTVFELLF